MTTKFGGACRLNIGWRSASLAWLGFTARLQFRRLFQDFGIELEVVDSDMAPTDRRLIDDFEKQRLAGKGRQIPHDFLHHLGIDAARFF